MTTAEWSYQYWPGAPEQERLYHLPSDPGQEHDLRAERPQVARDLRALYLDWLREQNPELCGWLERIEREPGVPPGQPRPLPGGALVPQVPAGPGSAGPTSGQARRPNILLLMADQHRADAIGAARR